MGIDLSLFDIRRAPRAPESPENALMRGLEIQRARQGNALQAMQMQAYEQQQREAAAQRADLQRVVQSIPSPQMAASQNALAAGGGPTVANAARIQPADPRLQMLHQIMQQSGGRVVSPVDYLKQAIPEPEYKVVGDALVKIVPTGVSEAYKGDKGPKLPEGMQMGPNGPQWIPGYLEGRGQVARAGSSSIVNYGSPVPVQLPDGSVGYVQPSNRGGPVAPMADAGGKPLVKPSEADTKALTEGQAKAVAFASRMESADKVLAELSRKGVQTTVPGGMGNNAVGSAITAVSSADQQKLMQAKRNFINAVLRRESGAVISADEFANAERQYFPQIGDSRPVIEQKARERRVAIEGMRADVPKGRQSEVDRISGGGDANNDPLGLRGK